MNGNDTLSKGVVEAPTGTYLGSPLPPGVEERLVEAGGVRFRYLTGGAGPGRPVIFLHGWPTWGEVWLPLAREIGVHHPWVAPDLPGQGRSSPLPGADRSLPAHRRAIAAFADAIGFPNYAVVGNSMGGTLAIMLALDRPERVSQIAVLDAAGLTDKFPGRTARMYLPFLLPCLLRAPGPGSVRSLLAKAVFYDARFADDAWVNAIVEGWKPHDRRRGLMAIGFSLRRPDASVAAELHRIGVPTLILSGREDRQFLWQTAEEASHRVPRSQFGVIERAGHFPMVEQPAETARRVSGFLDSG